MNHAAMRLGRTRPSSQQRGKALRLRDYLTAPLPPPPATCRNTDGAALGMWGNDVLGDCTFAALANYRAICAVKESAGTPPTTEEAVKSSYLRFNGDQDIGAVENDVLNLALAGVDLGGPQWMLASWVTVDASDVAQCKSLIALFGALYLGVELPTSAQSQDVWTPVQGVLGNPGSWGGHALLWANYTEQYNGLVTWGAEKLCTTEWLAEYCDEAHCLLDADRAQAVGVDWNALVADMAYVAKTI